MPSLSKSLPGSLVDALLKRVVQSCQKIICGKSVVRGLRFSSSKSPRSCDQFGQDISMQLNLGNTRQNPACLLRSCPVFLIQVTRVPSPVQKLVLIIFVIVIYYAISILVLGGRNDLLIAGSLLDNLLSNSMHFCFLSITTQLPCISCVRS